MQEERDHPLSDRKLERKTRIKRGRRRRPPLPEFGEWRCVGMRVLGVGKDKMGKSEEIKNEL